MTPNSNQIATVFWCVNGITFFIAMIFSHVHRVRLIVKFGEGKEFPSGVYWQLFFSCFCPALEHEANIIFRIR